MEKEILVEVENVKRYFKINRNMTIKAVDDISFNIRRGETLGLVGESGCGKTTSGRCIGGLYDLTSGRIKYRGKDLSTMSRREKKLFHKDVQIIFQDPHASIDPRMKVRDIIMEGMVIQKILTNKEDRIKRVLELLKLVGLEEDFAERYINEFSGGQRQRIGIARALALEAKFIICDEPISALDVSIQAQIINLLEDLQKQLNLTYLFIAHDLSVVKHISDRIIVMYLGQIVEISSSDSLYSNPLHPYTQALISAIPIPDPRTERERTRIKLPGETASVISDIRGCKFKSRCNRRGTICEKEVPKLREIKKGHRVACHFVD